MNEQSNNNEFKIFGITIEKFSIFYGLFLILWGVIVSLVSESNSFTSFIPSLIGLPILIFSLLSIKFVGKKKFFMHIVALLGLIAFLGGFDFFRSVINGNTFHNVWADTSKIILLITGAFFVYQCIKSFFYARKNKIEKI